MSELHYVTLGRGEPLIDAMVRWDATLPSGAYVASGSGIRVNYAAIGW